MRLDADKQQVEEQLIEKEERLLAEQQEKNQLEAMLSEMQNKLVSGGQ